MAWPPQTHQDVQDAVTVLQTKTAQDGTGAFPRGELGFVQTNQDITANSSTPVVIYGLDISIPVGTRPVMVTAAIPWMAAPTAGTTLVLQLWDAVAGVELQRTVQDFPVTGSFPSRPISARLNPGSGTRRIQYRCFLYSGTVPVNIYNSLAPGPGYISAVEV